VTRCPTTAARAASIETRGRTGESGFREARARGCWGLGLAGLSRGWFAIEELGIEFLESLAHGNKSRRETGCFSGKGTNVLVRVKFSAKKAVVLSQGHLFKNELSAKSNSICNLFQYP